MKKTKIGGQALLEGVMMQGSTAIAVAVRDGGGVIRTKTERIKKHKNIFYKIPVVRGVFYFVRSLVTGVKVLTDSARVLIAEDAEEVKSGKSAAENKKDKKKKEGDGFGLAMFIAVALSLAFSVGLFILLPNIITNFLTSAFGWTFEPFVKNLIEGLIKILIFIGYLLIVSLMKDIRRTFMYHGAEHRTINAYEKGFDLTIENIQKQTTFHPRCGTSFMFFVLFISIIVFSFLGNVDNNVWLRLGLRLAVLPIVAGLSYELLKLLALSDSKLLFPFKAPGFLLQKLSTRKPDDSMVEVALAAFNKVLALDADPDLATEDFVLPRPLKEVRENTVKAYEFFGIEKGGDIDWILSEVLGLKTAELLRDIKMSAKEQDRIKEIIKRRAVGEPLQYILGYTEFDGYKIAVNPAVLIPRPETELLVEEALGFIKAGDRVLDLCTGSGAIAVAVAKQSGAEIFGCDISADAIEVARKNAAVNEVSAEFFESDLFDNVEGKFDIIISNPPYIKTAEIETLQKEVKDFEPNTALDGGEDGLDFYRAIVRGAKEHLKDSGRLFLEIGEGQADAVKTILEEAGFTVTAVKKDYENIDRIVSAQC